MREISEIKEAAHRVFMPSSYRDIFSLQSIFSATHTHTHELHFIIEARIKFQALENFCKKFKRGLGLALFSLCCPLSLAENRSSVSICGLAFGDRKSISWPEPSNAIHLVPHIFTQQQLPTSRPASPQYQRRMWPGRKRGAELRVPEPPAENH